MTALPSGIAAGLARTGRPHLRPEDVAASLRTWRRISQQSRHELSRASDDHLFIGPAARDVLEDAVDALPPGLASGLQRLVDPADRDFLARTLSDPFADPILPWWRRRLHEQSHGPRPSRHRP